MARNFIHFNNALKRFFSSSYANLGFSILITFFTITTPLVAQTNCISYTPPLEWKSHFPFDLIYPIGKAYESSHECPTIQFWGTEREVCSIKTLTGIVKNLFLFRVVVQSLFTL